MNLRQAEDYLLGRRFLFFALNIASMVALTSGFPFLRSYGIFETRAFAGSMQNRYC